MKWAIQQAAVVASIALSVNAQTSYDGDPTTDENLYQFKSRPDLYPPRLFVNQSDDGVVPGYIFMAPYQSYQNSAAIYSTDGTLIYYGFALSAANNVHDFKVCQYNGSDHLCLYQGQQYRGYARGHATILNDQLEVVKTVTALNGLSGLDQHEFNIVGDSALTTIYTPQRFDLSAYNITDGEGWIQDSVFQDVDLTTGELNFEWRAIEHVALSEGYVNPNQSEVSGTGFSALSPWDYFHINSVDKNTDGDYLISARHVSTLYKINGQTGEIIWRCGGKLSDFDLPSGLNWSYQHDARWVSYNASTEIISFFDNASNGFNRSANHSAGYIIQLNHDANPPSVNLLHSYPAPEDIPASDSQGNLQVYNNDDFANSNALASWGSQPYITEHAPDGTIIYRANVATDGKMNYRSYKFNVTITPTEDPALYTFAVNRDSNTTYYMSWNGATQLARWRIYGRSGCDGNWTLIDEVDRTEFETSYVADGFQEFGMVEAVSADGTGLRNSTNRGITPFVPSSGLGCSGDGCPAVSAYVQGSSQDVIAETQTACAALAVQTQNSTEGGGSSNTATHVGGGIWTMLSISVCSCIVVGLIL